MKVIKMSVYDATQWLSLFKPDAKIIAYGKGEFYRKVNQVVEGLGLQFSYVSYTQDSKIQVDGVTASESIDRYFEEAVVVICSTYAEEMIEQIKKEELRPQTVVLVDLRIQQPLYNECLRAIRTRVVTAHKALIERVRKKKRIKVVFLAHNAASWKVDTLFRAMLEDDYFDPVILIYPRAMNDERETFKTMQETFSYFKKQGYPTLNSYDNEEWIQIDEIKPDLVFLLNPHGLTKKDYFEDVLYNYLTCYVPYFFLTVQDGENYIFYNSIFYSSVLASFMPHECSLNEAIEYSATQAINHYLTGYPFAEQLLQSTNNYKDSVWKRQKDNKIKIIYAPHHKIDKNYLYQSNFLEVAELIKELAGRYSQNIQWSFKPHPLLKSRLYQHSDWGKEKTNKYYEYWSSNDYTQLDEDDYVQLFHESDAIIHDCSSFTVEYALLEKPCAYLLIERDEQLQYMNDFAIKALDSYQVIRKIEEIELFIKQLLIDKSKLIKQNMYFKKYIKEYYQDATPHKKIIDIIKKKLLT